MAITVTALTIYPVKSCAGISVESFNIDHWGPAGDRRWMLVDEAGSFLTQRVHPRMALIRPIPGPAGLKLSVPGQEDLLVAPGRAARKAKVWKDEVPALDEGDAAAAWLSDFLKLSCRLVRMDEGAHFRPEGASFADACPFLAISEESLADLNSRMAEPLPMNRFRPNIVVKGGAPYGEDDWTKVRIGELAFRAMRPCTRCAITTVDQKTAATGPEPLRTLATYRRRDGQVWFGQNLAHEGTGGLSLGARVELL